MLSDKPRQGVEPGTHLSPEQQEHAELTFGSVNKQMNVASGVVQRADDMAEVSGPYVKVGKSIPAWFSGLSSATP